MKNIRQKLFYDNLVAQNQIAPDEWFDKKSLAWYVNGEHNANKGYITEPLYVLNNDPTAHDICSLMNADRLEINESLAYEKIILVKDNKFKIANLEETLAEEEKIRKEALKQLWRGSMIKAKRLQDNQIVIDFENEVEKVIETFGRK